LQTKSPCTNEGLWRPIPGRSRRASCLPASPFEMCGARLSAVQDCWHTAMRTYVRKWRIASMIGLRSSDITWRDIRSASVARNSAMPSTLGTRQSPGVIKAPPPQNSGGTRRYDWAEVQRYYDEGHSYRECRIRFGFAAESWHKAVRRGAIRTRDPRWPIDRVLREAKNRTHIKTDCLRQDSWRTVAANAVSASGEGKTLSIQIDHINGIKTTTVWKICVCFVRTATAKPKRLRAAIDQTN
jgi:hypothetical protein